MPSATGPDRIGPLPTYPDTQGRPVAGDRVSVTHPDTGNLVWCRVTDVIPADEVEYPPGVQLYWLVPEDPQP